MLETLQQQKSPAAQHQEKDRVNGGEHQKIASAARARSAGVQAQGNEAGHGGHQGAQAADIDPRYIPAG